MLETSNAVLRRVDDNIICLTFPRRTTHTLVTMTEHLNGLRLLDLTNNGVLLLVDLNNLIGVTKEARTMVSNPDMTKTHKAVAMLVSNPLTRLIASFFLGLNKPKFPIKSFTNSDDAILWLLKQC
tara:strand:- start:892 stop:1266 length:375 start_codon:yes stop_codon:yes gene_type:complete